MRGILLLLLPVINVALASADVITAAPLDRVLRIVPRDLSDAMIAFTDWSQIKAELGLGFLTGDGPLALRIELMRRTSQDHAAASAYAAPFVLAHVETWGWDSADLDWEANVVGRELAPSYILKLRPGFDFLRIATRFSERGFVQSESHGAIVYMRRLDPSADWIRTTRLSILTTAYIEEDGLLILSSSPASVEALLATRAGDLPSISEDPFVAAAADRLAAPASAILMYGLGTCLRFTGNPILELLAGMPAQAQISELRAKVAGRELLVPYRALAVGYRTESRRPIGTIAFEYDRPELAAADLTSRALLAEEGMSTHSGAPISESLFTILDTALVDRAIVWTVRPVDEQPNRLFRMVFLLDAAFAGCSS